MKSSQRASGTELLKLAALLIIVICHVTESACTPVAGSPTVPPDLNCASESIRDFVLICMNHLGKQGSCIFFVCSAWFLVDSSSLRVEKIFTMLFDIWAVSAIFLIAYKLCGVMLSGADVLRCLLPTTFQNNWYLTTYLVFYAIHKYLNIAIGSMSRRELFTISAVCAFAVMVVGTVFSVSLYFSNLAVFISIYLIIAYMKKYRADYCTDIRANLIALLAGTVLLLLALLALNYAGLRNPALSWYVEYINRNNNPLFFVIAFSLLNLTGKLKFSSRTVNYLSSLTLLVYIIHENLLFRTYTRPAMLHRLYSVYGIESIIPIILVFSLILLAVSMALGALYRVSLGRFSSHVSEKLTKKLYLTQIHGKK